MKKNVKLLNFLIFTFLIFTIFFFTMQTGMDIFKYRKEYKKQLIFIKETYTKNQKSRIKKEVMRANNSIVNIMSNFDKDIIETSEKISDMIKELLKSHKILLSEGDLKIDKKFLNKILNLKGISIYIWDKRDSLIFFSESTPDYEKFKKILKGYKNGNKKDNFIYFNKVISGKARRQSIFISELEEKEVFIAVDVDCSEYFQGNEKKLFEGINTYRYGDRFEGSITVIDNKDQIFLHGNKKLIGMDARDILVETGKRWSTLINNAVDNYYKEGFYEYRIYDKSRDKVVDKLAFAMVNPKLDLKIVSGLYMDNINDEIEKAETKIQQEAREIITFKLIFLMINLFLFILLAMLLKRNIQTNFKEFSEFFEKVIDENKKIEIDKLRFSEFIQLGTAANHMLEDKIKLEKKLLEIINYDNLTHIPNRQYFFDYLKNIYKIIKKEHRGFSLLILNIDNFKSINDKYGYQIGDKVLLNFSREVKKHMRKGDFFARINGEEFAIIIFNEHNREAVHFAERILDSTRHSILESNHFISITVSIGVVQSRDYPDLGEWELFNIAVENMKEAKKAGKNMVFY